MIPRNSSRYHRGIFLIALNLSQVSRRKEHEELRRSVVKLTLVKFVYGVTKIFIHSVKSNPPPIARSTRDALQISPVREKGRSNCWYLKYWANLPLKSVIKHQTYYWFAGTAFVWWMKRDLKSNISNASENRKLHQTLTKKKKEKKRDSNQEFLVSIDHCASTSYWSNSE